MPPAYVAAPGLTEAFGAHNYPSGPLAIGQARCRTTRPATLFTERAARRIGEIPRREPAGAMLRVSVEGGSCSGFQYRFDIDRSQTADDVLIQCGPSPSDSMLD